MSGAWRYAVRSPVSPSSVAGAPPSPPGGRLLRQSLTVRDIADSSGRLRSRTEKIRTAGRSLPPGGEGGASATDEGEIGERNHVTQPSRRSILSLPKGRILSGILLLYVVPLNNGDPACWRPAWGGVRLCGNDWWERVIFSGWCRFAQDDTWGTGAWYHICLV